MRWSRAAQLHATFLTGVLALAGCELTEITLATPADVIVAEVVLRTGVDVQGAYLHRTAGTNGSARVFGALVVVRDDETGRALTFEVGADSLCLRAGEGNSVNAGTCYVARNARDFVRPEARYSLRIEVENRVMTGRLQVPGPFRLRRPGELRCTLQQQQLFELVWTRSAGAWVYVADARFGGLRQALRAQGIDVPGTAPVDLTGLAISGADTTLVFPSELGLFDRFDADLHPIVLAIQGGLPPGVFVDLTIGAGDRNYVNWVRGGSFNPSGQVRVPSIQGDGTGVFGALVPVQQQIDIGFFAPGTGQCV
jgi:hypothetical protein